MLEGGTKIKKNPKKREEVRNEENFNYYLDFGINWAIWGKQSKTKNYEGIGYD